MLKVALRQMKISTKKITASLIKLAHGSMFSEFGKNSKGTWIMLSTDKYKSGKKKGQFKYLKAHTLTWSDSK